MAPFTVDDLVSGVLDFLVDLLALVGVERIVAGQRVQSHMGTPPMVADSPQQDFGVAVLAGDVGVHVLDVDAGLLGNQEAQASGVQVGAGTKIWFSGDR